MARKRKEPEESEKPKRVENSSCPRAWSHRSGAFCKTCGKTIK